MAVCSWFLVSLGHPAYLAGIAPVAAIGGYALFWLALLHCNSVFWPSTCWFALVQLFWVRWMGTCASSSWLALAGGALLSLSIGLQFGLLSHLVCSVCAHRGAKKGWIAVDLAGLSGFWALLEASRLLWWSGFPMNSVGLCLLAHSNSRQAASFAGIYGLSLWVIGTNLILLRLFCTQKRWPWGLALSAMALMPYCSGYLLPKTVDRGRVRIGICATGWIPQAPSEDRQLPWTLLRAARLEKSPDILLLPEGFTPFYASSTLVARNASGDKSLSTVWRVAQGLARELGSGLIVGLAESDGAGSHQCAYYFSPEKRQLPGRYIKRVLVPVGEYLPPICPPPLQEKLVIWAQKQGFEQFKPGHSSTAFAFKDCRIYPMICYEEAFPNFAEGTVHQRADLIVGLSNDGWYPNSSLIEHHFWEAMCRSLETGLPMVRSANCGLATAVSAKGEILLMRRSPPAGELAIHEIDLPLATRSTPYRNLGLSGIMGLAFLGVGVASAKFFVEKLTKCAPCKN